MLLVKSTLLLFALGVVVGEGDTEITRVRTLTDEERVRPAPLEKTERIYAINLVPIPQRQQEARSNAVPGSSNDLGGGQRVPYNTVNRYPTLFLLQRVKDNSHLPDGIYFRPDDDETETPKPAFIKELNDVQSFILAHGPHRSPGRQ